MEEVIIIMPNFNMAGTLRESIQSVVDQTFANWRLIIADGGSADNSLEIARSFKDNRIEVYQDITPYPAERITKYMKYGNSEFCTFLASDDKFEPTFLEENIKLLKEKQEIDFVYNSYTISTYNHKMELLGTRKQSLSTPTEGCLDTGMFMGIFYLFRRSLFDKVGKFDIAPGNTSAYDYLFCMQCEYVGAKFFYLDKHLGWYRLWPKSDTGTSSPYKFWMYGENTRTYEFTRRKQCKR